MGEALETAYLVIVSTGNRATTTHPSCRSLKMTRDDNAQRGANRLRIDTGNACARVFHSVAPTRCTLRNSKEAPLFELFFAVSNPTGEGPAMRIANHILRDW